LLQAIDLSARDRIGLAPKWALDLGCGPGREACALLEAGFDVLAMDLYESMVEATRELAAPVACSTGRTLEVVCAPIESGLARLETERFELLHAGFVLPFVAVADFAEVMGQIARVLRPRGVFCGQLFGPDDSFLPESPPGAMNCHTASDIDRVFRGYEILHREEVNRSGFIGRGQSKWWHVHHIIARRL